MYPTSGESCWYSCIHSPCSLPAERVTLLSQSKASCGSAPWTAFLLFSRQFLPECYHTLNHASFLDEEMHFLPVKFCRNVWFFSSKRAGGEQENAEHCWQRALNKIVSNTERRFLKRFYEGHFPHVHQIDFYLSPKYCFPIRVEYSLILLRNAVIIRVWNNSLIPKNLYVVLVLPFEPQQLYDKHNLSKDRQ